MIYIDCDDPRVLTEHLQAHGYGSVEFNANAPAVDGGWIPGANAYTIGKAGEGSSVWRHRLVFEDAEAAGRGLADYRDRLGAKTEHRFDDDMPWRLSRPGGPREIVNLISAGEIYRVAAPAPIAPEAPSGEAKGSEDRAWPPVGSDDATGLYSCPVCAESAAAARPALPEGVEPVAWSDKYGAWVLNIDEVPDDWEWGPGRDTHGELTLVLARPVPAPETERVPWWDAVKRTTPDGRIVCEASRTLGGIVLWKRSGPSDVFQEFAPDADGTVEVLRDGSTR